MAAARNYIITTSGAAAEPFADGDFIYIYFLQFFLPTPTRGWRSTCVLWISRIDEHVTEYQEPRDMTGVCFERLCQMFRFPLPSPQEAIGFF